MGGGEGVSTFNDLANEVSNVDEQIHELRVLDLFLHLLVRVILLLSVSA